jgi:hypothetical protein
VPNHGRGRGDRCPSLSVNPGDNGTPVVYCHAGCETEDVLAAIGWSLRDLYEDDSRPPSPRDRYVAAKVVASELRVANYRERRRIRDADVLVDAIVQLIRTGQDFTGSIAFTCPWCQVGHAWVRRDHAGFAADCDQGCSGDDVLGALAELREAT